MVNNVSFYEMNFQIKNIGLYKSAKRKLITDRGMLQIIPY